MAGSFEILSDEFRAILGDDATGVGDFGTDPPRVGPGHKQHRQQRSGDPRRGPQGRASIEEFMPGHRSRLPPAQDREIGPDAHRGNHEQRYEFDR